MPDNTRKPPRRASKNEYRKRVPPAAGRRITVTIRATEDEGGYLRLSEFLKQLDAIKAALKHTERLLSGSEERTVYYRIVSLSYSSPARMVLEERPLPVPDKRPKLPRVPTAQRLVSSLSQIERQRAPKGTDLAALEAYRNVGTLVGHRVREVSLRVGEQEVLIDNSFTTKIEKIIGPDHVVEGSITGVLLAINLHNTTRFEIYPSIGPRKIACDFPSEMKRRVIEGLDRNVRVYGRLRYKHWSDFPHAISARDIEVFPPENELPTMMDLRGIANDPSDDYSDYRHDGDQ
jgi:hypothetical protein